MHIVCFGFVAHVFYSLLLATFPTIDLISFKFLGSCGLLVCNHYLWFQFFANQHQPFRIVMGIFFICVWLVPFTFFVSLSANESVLPGPTSSINPSIGDRGLGSSSSKGKLSVLSFFKFLSARKEEYMPPHYNKSS
eukprot:TRINITY_DN8108_c0_g1_i1.p1 TRINITY_DN8108_c0_g1~~TRINITY_DN8108_c0_g1_i1.p1  ORF type:complete len:136 (-),score=28.46 TRINITY_DN8108_c0_g1_i1:86-493(-)